ncbi:pentapeptide repeat-containing protein [Micromonospora sp. WP24]|uniref:pentapeptide repeat-containing protein n=1 Tax=Micromonospora sp. WP24 TaxID=2604469 RepID=UPI0016521E23|nr:pentapeptide repeat-containing protein [Micromonospora sp. WP24]
MFVLAVGPWLLTRHPQKGLTSAQALTARNDVRATLVQALAGLAVAGGLVVTYRTFRQNQAEQDRNYALRQAEQMNALYTKAVEQLGHEEAPVRLGALYSLVHLAQANPHQRQTVVDVLCAYLRMPFAPPGSASPITSTRDPAQELQVRLTAQRLLAKHLFAPEGVSGEDAQKLSPTLDETFWPGIVLDLTRATLIDFSLHRASIRSASFVEATFTGLAMFDGVTFTSNVLFTEGKFPDNAWFRNATFADVWFVDATFNRIASFHKTTFIRGAMFGGATFSSGALCDGAQVLHLDDPDLNKGGKDARRVWPDGWTVRPDADDPTRGTLTRGEAGLH